MSSKQARLVAAISDAMAAQKFGQNNLARASGVAQSMISAALQGKYDLKEEKWRLLCEALALDYDEIISDPETAHAAMEQATEEPSAADESPREAAAAVQQQEAPCCGNAVPCEPVKIGGGIVAEYLESKLQEDLRAGTEMPLEALHVLLDHLRDLRR